MNMGWGDHGRQSTREEEHEWMAKKLCHHFNKLLQLGYEEGSTGHTATYHLSECIKKMSSEQKQHFMFNAHDRHSRNLANWWEAYLELYEPENIPQPELSQDEIYERNRQNILKGLSAKQKRKLE